MTNQSCENCDKPALWKVTAPSGHIHMICDIHMDVLEESFENADDVEVDVIQK